MALNYRRGSASITEAANRRASGGNFRPFIPQILWRKDGESKYVLVLTDMEEVAELLLHSFIPVGKGTKSDGEEFTRYEEFLSRRDVCVGEDSDELEDRLQREPKFRHMGVMAELEPVMNGKKIGGFVVATETFNRKTDDGEVETTAPIIGLCTQSAQLMWGPINNLYQRLGDLSETPISITRNGVQTNTRYDMIPFMEKPVDVTPILEHLDGINYIGEDLEKVQQLVEAEETDTTKAQAVAQFMLEKRIHELGDAERYEELVTPLKLEDMPKNPWGSKKDVKKPQRNVRPVRRSPRETVQEEEEASAPSKNEQFAALKSRVEARA